MPTLNRRIYLIEPGTRTQSKTGVVSRGAATRHKVWARRRQFSGSEGVQDDIQLSRTRTEYMIRRSGFQEMDTQWTIEDDGKKFRIQSVIEANFAPRQFLIIDAILFE